MTSPLLFREGNHSTSSQWLNYVYETKFAFSPFHEESLHTISEDCLLEDLELQISAYTRI